MKTRILLDSGAPTLYHKYARGAGTAAVKSGMMGSHLKDRKHDNFDWLDNPDYLAYRERYAQYILQHKDKIEVYTNLDIVNNPHATWENQQYFESLGLSPLPVWHFGSDISWLKHYLRKGYDHIGIGGLVPNPYTTLRPALDEIWSQYLTDANGFPLVKVHGFAATSIPLMCRYPWHCMSYNHKVLTKEGWKGGDEVCLGELILCHDENGNSVWKPVTKLHHYENTPIVNIKRRNFHAEVTPNHRWMLYHERDDYRFFMNTERLRQYRNVGIERFGNYTFPIKSPYTDDYVQLAAWFFSEGSIRQRPRYKNNSISIYQSERANPEFCEHIRQLLQRMNENHCEGTPTKRDGTIAWEIYGNACKQLLQEFPNKVPTWEFLFSLTEEQCAIFVETSICADGYLLKNSKRHGRKVGITQNMRTQDLIWILQGAMFLLKRPSSVQVDTKYNKILLQESRQKYIRMDCTDFYDKGKSIIENSKITEGDTWCVEVETGAFYTQCNGYVYVTGNSVDSASWIKYAAFGGIMIPAAIRGVAKYTERPYKISVSGKSPLQKKNDMHITNIGSPALEKYLLDYIASQGFVLGLSEFDGDKEIVIEPGLVNRPEVRCQFNALYYMGLRDELPPWPWPFKATKGLSLW